MRRWETNHALSLALRIEFHAKLKTAHEAFVKQYSFAYTIHEEVWRALKLMLEGSSGSINPFSQGEGATQSSVRPGRPKLAGLASNALSDGMKGRIGRRPRCKIRTVRYAGDKETFRNRSREFLRYGHTLRLVDRAHRVPRSLHRTDNLTFLGFLHP